MGRQEREEQQQTREKQRELSWEQSDIDMRRKQQETPADREQLPGWRPRLLEDARLFGSVDSLPSLARRSQETWLSSKVKCTKTFLTST